MQRRPWRNAFAWVVFLSAVQTKLPAQSCVTELGDVTTVSAQLAVTTEPGVVFDIAARYGERVVPALRKLSKPERPIETPEGAAQAALAKLGDKAALEELRQELEGTQVREKRPAIWKLGFAATPETASILMSFLLTDNCKHCLHFGDTGEDPRVFVHEMLTRMLPNPPIERSTFTDSDLAVWQTWWQTNKGRLTMVEPHRKLSDPNLRCLATRAEWHRVEAVALLAEEGGTSVIPALRELVQLGYKDELGNFSTVRGAARTALAMLGDRSEFDAILQELRSHDYVDGLLKLRYIGTRTAVDAITINLGETAYITSDRNSNDYKAQVKLRRYEFLGTLAQMVRNSPLMEKDSYTEGDVELWKNWWAKNRDHAELALKRS
jgi:hypothetical protein